MSDVELLAPDVQEDFRQALIDSGFSDMTELLGSSIAALAVIGAHPESLRGAGLAILPVTERLDLYAKRILERNEDNGIVRWALTSRGASAAAVLHRAMPPLKSSEEQFANQRREVLLEESKRSLGLLE